MFILNSPDFRGFWEVALKLKMCLSCQCVHIGLSSDSVRHILDSRTDSCLQMMLSFLLHVIKLTYPTEDFIFDAFLLNFVKINHLSSSTSSCLFPAQTRPQVSVPQNLSLIFLVITKKETNENIFPFKLSEFYLVFGG